MQKTTIKETASDGRIISDTSNMYLIFMWAKHEVQHQFDNLCQPYRWIPRAAIEAKTPLTYARKVIRDSNKPKIWAQIKSDMAKHYGRK